MKIDRARAQRAFADYAAHYNTADPKVKLKIDHTYYNNTKVGTTPTAWQPSAAGSLKVFRCRSRTSTLHG